MKTAKTNKKAILNNTINAKRFYFIADNFIYCTIQNSNKEFIPAISKESLSEKFNIADLKNIVLPGALLKQIELYLKDDFKIDNIQKADQKIIITLSNNLGNFAKLEQVFYNLTDDIKPVTNKPIIADLSQDYVLIYEDINKIKTALKYISKDELRQSLCNVLISQNKVVSCDGVILYFDDLSFSLENDIILSSKDLSQFFKSNKTLKEATLQICQGFCSINDFEINLIDSKYPDYNSLIPCSYSDSITIKKDNFPLKVKSGINPLTQLISFNNSGFHGKDSTTDSIVDYCFETNCKSDFNFGLNYKKAVTIIKELKTDEIQIKHFGKYKPIMINDNFLIMTIKSTDEIYQEQIKQKEPIKVEPIQETKIEVCREILEKRFCFKQFAIYYLIANLEQQKEITLDQLKSLFYGIANLQNEYEINTEKECERMKNHAIERLDNIQNDYFNGKDISISDFIFLCYKVRTSFTFDFQLNLKKKLDFINNGKQLKKCKLSYELQVLKDKLNNLNLEQSKEPIKPLQNNLPALITIKPKQEPKTVLKQVLSLTAPKQILQLQAPVEQIEQAEYTEIVTNVTKASTLDDFYGMYYSRLKQKRSVRKSNNKITAIFEQIGQFSSVACLIFLFLNTFVMINKHESTFKNLAKVEVKSESKQENGKEPIKTISDLSDCNVVNTIALVDKEPLKTVPFDVLNLITIGLFGIIKRKEEKTKSVIGKKICFKGVDIGVIVKEECNSFTKMNLLTIKTPGGCAVIRDIRECRKNSLNWSISND